MTFSQIPKCFDCGFFLTAVFHTGAAAQAPPSIPQLEANLEYTR